MNTREIKPCQHVRRWWGLLLLIPLLAGGGFVIWAASAPAPMPQAIAALETSVQADGVAVTASNWLAFRPTGAEPTSGLVLCPGGRVDPRAYAPLARAIAREGHLVVIAPMPLNLAFLAPNRASVVMRAFPSTTQWAVGSHSLGGAMAARFMHRHPSAAEGLVLWASYPAKGDDLSERDLLAVSI